MAVQVSKELDAKKSVENPEEDEEESDIVNLLARPLEDLVEAGLGHGEAEAGPDEPDHDERSRRPTDVERWVVEAGELNAVENFNEMKKRKGQIQIEQQIIEWQWQSFFLAQTGR